MQWPSEEREHKVNWYRLRIECAQPSGRHWSGRWACIAAASKQAASAAQRLVTHRGRRAGWSVATAHRPPFMFVDQEAGVFTGLLVELLPLLFMAAGFNTTASSFSYYAAPTNSGGSLVNGSWTGGQHRLALS